MDRFITIFHNLEIESLDGAKIMKKHLEHYEPISIRQDSIFRKKIKSK